MAIGEADPSLFPPVASHPWSGVPPPSSPRRRISPVATHSIDSNALRVRLQHQLTGAYVIDRELGGGGSSAVFLAKDIALDRPVVLKVLPPALVADVDAERFRREIQIAARLQHPHLVPLLSASPDAPAGDHEQVRWFSMPYIEGPTLRERLARRGPPPLPEALQLLREIALALAYAHARGVVHRDIKPENVLLNDGIAMISDFGVAKALDDASDAALQSGRRITTVSTALGTPAYMAPEQVVRSHAVDHRADLYAFGCVAYEVLTGNPPFVRPSLRATMAAQLSEAPVPMLAHCPGLPPALADIVMRCLAKNPAERPASATWVVRAIEQAMAWTPADAETDAAAPPASAAAPPPPIAVQWLRRSILGTALALVAAAVLWGILG